MKVRRLREDELMHHGVKGQRWGVRRYQNPDGTLTPAGRARYLNPDGSYNARYHDEIGSRQKQQISGKQTNLTDKQVRNRRNALVATSIITAAAGLTAVAVASKHNAFDSKAKKVVDAYHNHKLRNIKSPNQLRAAGIKLADDNLADKIYSNTMNKDFKERREQTKKLGKALKYGTLGAVGTGSAYALAKGHDYNGAMARRKYKRDKERNSVND